QAAKNSKYGKRETFVNSAINDGSMGRAGWTPDKLDLTNDQQYLKFQTDIARVQQSDAENKAAKSFLELKKASNEDTKDVGYQAASELNRIRGNQFFNKIATE